MQLHDYSHSSLLRTIRGANIMPTNQSGQLVNAKPCRSNSSGLCCFYRTNK